MDRRVGPTDIDELLEAEEICTAVAGVQTHYTFHDVRNPMSMPDQPFHHTNWQAMPEYACAPSYQQYINDTLITFPVSTTCVRIFPNLVQLHQ